MGLPSKKHLGRTGSKTFFAISGTVFSFAFTGSSFAQSTPGTASSEITITGVAQEICRMPTPPAAGSGSINGSFSNSTVTLSKFLDPVTALVNPASVPVTFSGAMCNYAANVSVASLNGGLTSTDAVTPVSGSGAFLTKVPYTVSVNWGAVNLSFDTTSGTSATKPTGGANVGDLSLTINTARSTLPVPQGTYTDVLTVKIGANL